MSRPPSPEEVELALGREEMVRRGIPVPPEMDEVRNGSSSDVFRRMRVGIKAMNDHAAQATEAP